MFLLSSLSYGRKLTEVLFTDNFRLHATVGTKVEF